MSKKSTSNNDQLRTIALVAIAIAATLGIAAFFVLFTDTDTTVTLVNDSNCPQAALVLESIDAPTVRLFAGPGERTVSDIVPDVDYEYTRSTISEEPDENNRECLDFDTGTFRPARGSNTTFRFESVTRPFVVIEVDAQCPPATITLSSANDRDREPVELNPGESEEVELNPAELYTYSIDLVELASGEPCTEIESETISLDLNESDTIRIAPEAE